MTLFFVMTACQGKLILSVVCLSVTQSLSKNTFLVSYHQKQQGYTVHNKDKTGEAIYRPIQSRTLKLPLSELKQYSENSGDSSTLFM